MTVKKKIDVEYRQRGAKKAEKELHKLGTTIQSTIAAYGSAGIALFGFARFMSQSIDAYKVQERADLLLRRGLESTGHAAGLTYKELKKMAVGLAEVTNYADETINNAQGLMLTFTKIGKEVFPQAVEAAMDMSAKMGTDLKQSVIQLGIALNDPIAGVGRLRKVGVSLTEEQKAQIKVLVAQNKLFAAQKIILDELAVEFGGAARAEAEGFGGSITQLSEAFVDMQEKFGKMIAKMNESMPVVEGAAFAFKQIGEAVEKLNTFDPTAIAAYMGMKFGVYLTAEAEAIKEVTDNLEEQNPQLMANAAYHQSIIDRVKDAEQAYLDWAAAKQEKIDKDILELEFLERWNEEHPQKMEAVKEMNIEIENYNSLLVDSGLKLEKVGKIGTKTFTSLEKRAEEASVKYYKSLGENFVNPISGAFQQALADGTNVFTALGDAFERMLIQMVSDFMARAAIFGFLSLVTGIPFMDLAAGSLPGFQHGGSFQVGGSGGADSQVVAFKATPGERVDITPPGEAQGQVINNNFYGTIIGEDRWIRDNLLPNVYRAWNRGY